MAKTGKRFLVDTQPTKRVIVESLTRDASAEAFIFDLIDNSIDAARQAIFSKGKVGSEPELPLDYSGYRITLTLSSTGFKIEDNCSGIPVENLKSMVLRFGERSDQPMGIGVFGVGLNRALFRLGRVSHLATDTGLHRSVLILNIDEYLKTNGWELPAEEFPSSGKVGTSIEIQHLQASIAKDFADAEWVEKLLDAIGRRYGRFIAKKLIIEVNKIPAKDETVDIRENSPYDGEYKFYKTDAGVAVHIKYGQHLKHRFSKEDDYDQAVNKTLTDDYGWSIFCNDRAILISDKSYKTGWDTKFHTEFYGFVGQVNFIGDPLKLPWTTTKTDVDLNNPAYQDALVDMRRFAEKWRGIADRRKKSNEAPRPIPAKVDPGQPKPDPTTRPRTPAKPEVVPTVTVKAPVKKPDHNTFRTILPEDIDEKHCYDKHLALVHEGKILDLGDSSYAGLALVRMLFESSVIKFMERAGKSDELKNFAIAKREKKITLSDEAKKQLTPKIDEMIPFLENNYDVWGASTTHLKHSCKRMGAHLPTLNGVLHNPYQQINTSLAFQIRDEVLPLLRHLIEK